MKRIEDAKHRILASAIDTPQGRACYVGNALEELDGFGVYLDKMKEILLAITDQYEWMYETFGNMKEYDYIDLITARWNQIMEMNNA